MPMLTQLFGALLTVLGVVLYALATPNEETGRKSITALIPAFWGLALVVLGQLAEKEKWRMHAMHGAALLGVLGLIMPLVMALPKLFGGEELNLARSGQLLMALLCGAFTALCVKSFIDARRRRLQQTTERQVK